MKGYKVFNPDWTCRGFQYEVGQTYKHDGKLDLCNSGFHFCRKASDCFKYYSFDSKNKVAEVEALGFVESDDSKSVTDEIKIVREISWNELLDMVNEGKDCTGFCNTGDRNTGNHNTGDWNTGNRNTGFFNTITPSLFLFNKPTELTREKILQLKGVKVLSWNYENNWWIYSQNMSEEEKAEHPEHEALGGYLKTVDYKTACAMMWDKLDEEEKQAVRDIPNFDSKVFEEITGIKA